MIYRVFVEKKENLQAKKIREDLDAQLGIAVEDLREVIRYDAEGISEAELEAAVVNVFSEPPVDNVWREELPVAAGYKVFAIAFLDGQYDQRADSAAQCIQLLTQKARPLVKCARVICVKGVTDGELERIKKHLINPVESAEVSSGSPRLSPAQRWIRTTCRKWRALRICRWKRSPRTIRKTALR